MSVPLNPQAFPSPPNSIVPGMTLQDWFAGQALIGIMSTAGAFQRADRRTDMVAAKAYEFADAMLAARHPDTPAKGDEA